MRLISLLLCGLFFYVTLVESSVLSVQSEETPETESPAELEKKDWWTTAVFYQIYPRSFKDSNNDGTGDLQGIISKLDHLADAGIGAVWLSPIFKSPMADYGYDVSDFRNVDPIFGSNTDLKEFIDKAHSKSELFNQRSKFNSEP